MQPSDSAPAPRLCARALGSVSNSGEREKWRKRERRKGRKEAAGFMNLIHKSKIR